MEKPNELLDKLKMHKKLGVHMLPDMEVLINYIDYLESKDNSVSHSNMEIHFAFAEYLKDYDYVDNGSEGNEYLHAEGRFTEKEIYERWRDSL